MTMDCSQEAKTAVDSIAEEKGTIKFASFVDQEAQCEKTHIEQALCEAQAKKDDLRENRTNMTILHFVLTAPRWSLSLFLFLASISIPMQSPRQSIQVPLRRLHDFVEAESNSYLQCTQQAVSKVSSDLSEAVAQEVTRVADAQQANAEILQSAKHTAEVCFNATSLARESLMTWRDNGMTLPIRNDPSICGTDNLDLLSELLSTDFDLVESQVSTVLQEYVDASQKSVTLVADYAEKRTRYDVDYFLLQRIEPALEAIRNLRSGGSFHLNVDLAYIEARLSRTLLQLTDVFDLMVAQIELLTTRALQFAASIDDFYLHYLDLYGKMVDATYFVMDILPPGVPVPAVFDLSGVPIADSLLPPITTVPDFSDEIAAARDVIASVSAQILDIVADTIRELEEQAAARLDEVIRDITEQLAHILNLDDYDPPRFSGTREDIADIAQELDYHNDLGLKARSNVLEKLELLQSVSTLKVPSTQSVEAISSSNLTIKDDATTFEYLQPTIPWLSFPDLLAFLLEWLSENTWIFEVIIQALRLWRLERIYSRGAMPDMPEIDYGIADDEDEPSSARYMFLLKVLRTLATPWILLLMIVLPLSTVAVSKWYPSLHENCRASDNGTFLANNVLAPILVNEANFRGNLLYARGEADCKLEQRKLCIRYQGAADIAYAADLSTFGDQQSLFNRSKTYNGAVFSCVDPVLNNRMAEGCCGLRGYQVDGCVEQTEFICPIQTTDEAAGAFRPLREYSGDAVCPSEFESVRLQNAQFDCSPMLQVCGGIPCKGVNEDLLRTEIVRSDCEIQFFTMKCCLFVLVVVYHAVMINFYCSMIFAGIVRSRWRRLCPAAMAMLTKINEEGELVKGTEKADRARRFQISAFHFETVGKLQIGLGCAVFLGWFISILAMRHAL